MGPRLKSQLPIRHERKRLEILCGIAILAVLSATLWPFDLFPINRVSWLPETKGIRFDRYGVVVSDEPLRIGGGKSVGSCSLEILLRPANVESAQTILTFYTPDNPRPFLVREGNSDLLISHGFVDFAGLRHFFSKGQLVFLTVTSGPTGTIVYKDGRQARSFPRFGILQNDLSGKIVIGNSAAYLESWQGEIRGLAIYSKELQPAEVLRDYSNWTNEYGVADSDGVVARYAFSEGAGREIRSAVTSGPNLKIPKLFAIPSKGFLTSPAKDFEASWSYVFHLFENIVGFVPVGFIFCAYFAKQRSRWRAILYATVATGILSLMIEVLQANLPQRESDTTDIITNTLGALLGALLAQPAIVATILGRTKSTVRKNSVHSN